MGNSGIMQWWWRLCGVKRCLREKDVLLFSNEQMSVLLLCWHSFVFGTRSKRLSGSEGVLLRDTQIYRSVLSVKIDAASQFGHERAVHQSSLGHIRSVLHCLTTGLTALSAPARLVRPHWVAILHAKHCTVLHCATLHTVVARRRASANSGPSLWL